MAINKKVAELVVDAAAVPTASVATTTTAIKKLITPGSRKSSS